MKKIEKYLWIFYSSISLGHKKQKTLSRFFARHRQFAVSSSLALALAIDCTIIRVALALALRLRRRRLLLEKRPQFWGVK
jgi:hypothetical protein